MPAAALIAGQEDAADNLQVLSDLGVTMTMLDCSGARALAHVEDLPVGIVELAPQLVRRVADRGAGSAVARSVPPLVQLMQDCGVSVIVRGIDTAPQADWWRTAGADVAQGAFLAPPGPL